MTLDSFIAVGAVFGGIGISEARPAGKVAGFDGSEPGRLDRKACSGMQGMNKCGHWGGHEH